MAANVCLSCARRFGRGKRHQWQLQLVLIGILIYMSVTMVIRLRERDTGQDVKPQGEITQNRAPRSQSDRPQAPEPRNFDPDLVPDIDTGDVTCSTLFDGNDETEVRRVANLTITFPSDGDYVSDTANCDDFIQSRRYITSPLTAEERDFPLAYSIIMFKDLAQVEMLLRAIYRPQNLYCIHVDVKAQDDVKRGISALAKCFDNVFTSSRSIDVHWGQYSVLESELICMDDLLKRHKKWKYFINLTGQEFPMKTNWELVRILKAINGSNIISGNAKGAAKNARRTKWTYDGLKFMNRLLPPIPYNMTITKGPVHIVATRGFVEFAIDDPKGRAFTNWIKHTAIPDESFFSSLNANPGLGVPGAFKGFPAITETNPHIQRLKVWNYKGQELGACAGKIRKGICILGIGDLPKFRTASEKLFANKFYASYQPYVLKCLEQDLFNRVRLEVKGHRNMDVSYYEKLDFTLNHVPSGLEK